jgi:hypothetical protein
MMIRCATAVFLLQVAPAMAYPELSAKCKDVPEACIKDGTLDFVSVYGEIGYEDLDFFMMLDETLPSDAPFPRVYLNSYGGLVSAALGIGRMLHKHQATVESGSPVIPDATPQCTSACALLAQGAAHRRLTHVGLHSARVRVKAGKNVWQDHGETKEGVTAIRKYMTEMGAAEVTIRTIEETNFDEIEDFFFDPTMPAADQEITKLGFYSTEAQYFTSADMHYPNTVVFTRNSIYQQNAAEYGSIQASRDLALANLSYQLSAISAHGTV